VLKIGHIGKKENPISQLQLRCVIILLLLYALQENSHVANYIYIYIIKIIEIIDYGYSRKQKKKNPFILKEKVKSWAN
jgi:hypothetical protein